MGPHFTNYYPIPYELSGVRKNQRERHFGGRKDVSTLSTSRIHALRGGLRSGDDETQGG